MNWIKILTEIDSGGQSRVIANILETNPNEISSVLECMQCNNATVAWRAAWVIDNFARNNPDKVMPVFDVLTNILVTTPHHGVRRHITRILCDVDPAMIEDGRVVDCCIRWLSDLKSPVAVKANAMSVLGNLCTIYPELSVELIPIIESGMQNGTPGFRSRGKKILQLLNKETSESY